MRLILGLTLLLSLIYVIKTQDDCQIKSPGTDKIEKCDFDPTRNLKKGCKRPNVSPLSSVSVSTLF